MNELDGNYTVASMWLAIFMNSSTADDVERFQELSGFTPVEIRLLSMVESKKDMLLRDFLEAAKIPKSTLTSMVNRLEKRDYLKRVINPQTLVRAGTDRKRAALCRAVQGVSGRDGRQDTGWAQWRGTAAALALAGKDNGAYCAGGGSRKEGRGSC